MLIKRVGAVGAVVAIAVLAVGSVAPATAHGGGHGHGDNGDTIRVLSTDTEEEFVDVGEPDFSLGDYVVFTADLTTEDGTEAGHTGAVCTITSIVREEAQCVATAWLLDGQITIQGLIAGEPADFELPITGGSGAYEGAEGTLVVEELSDTEELLTFNLSD